MGNVRILRKFSTILAKNMQINKLVMDDQNDKWAIIIGKSENVQKQTKMKI